MPHKHLSDVVATTFRGNGIAGIANMPASPDIVRMQNIKADNLSGFPVLGQSGERLRRKERMAGFCSKLFLLEKGYPVPNNIVPRKGWCRFSSSM